MVMVCPQCSTAHPQRGKCPMCGTQLIFRDRDRPRGQSPVGRWRQKPWGRLLIGLFLAQGLFYGLRHLATGVLLGLRGEEGLQEVLQSSTGLYLLLGLQITALLPGAILVGSGQRMGLILGAFLGAWNGILAAYLPGGATPLNGPLSIYGLPLLQAFFGALGGALGSTIWKPPATSQTTLVPRPARNAAPRPRLPLFAGPVAWLRVLCGTSVAVAGHIGCAFLLRQLFDLFGHHLSTEFMDERFLIWEVRGLSMVLGGTIAGATRSNGIKQGLYVGIFTCIVLVGYQARFGGAFWQVAGLTLISTFSLSVVGGWFGCQLFPPVLQAKRARNLRSAPA
jgi:hypothetical protein